MFPELNPSKRPMCIIFASDDLGRRKYKEDHLRDIKTNGKIPFVKMDDFKFVKSGTGYDLHYLKTV